MKNTEAKLVALKVITAMILSEIAEKNGIDIPEMHKRLVDAIQQGIQDVSIAESVVVEIDGFFLDANAFQKSGRS